MFQVSDLACCSVSGMWDCTEGCLLTGLGCGLARGKDHVCDVELFPDAGISHLGFRFRFLDDGLRSLCR